MQTERIRAGRVFHVGLCSLVVACTTPDQPVQPDPGVDAARTLHDSATLFDAGPFVDAGPLRDAGGVADAGPRLDAEPAPDPLAAARVRAPAYLGFPDSADDRDQAPALLSLTGAFSEVATLELAPGLLPYDVVSPLWSDGALKQRWLALPEGESIGFDPAGAFSFPPGTVLVKHFGIALDERQPDVLRRMETRFLIADAEGRFYGVSYRWNDALTDASRVDEGIEQELSIIQEDGSDRVQTYAYPAPNDCGQCHSEGAGYALSPRASQLHRDYEYVAGEASEVLEQLVTWNALGLFEPPLSQDTLAALPRLAALDDESRSLEDRVRSYWDGNCSSCHNSQAAFQSWNARFAVPLSDQHVLDVVPMRGEGDNAARIVAPGDVSRSFMHQRVSSVEQGLRMPPLATYRVHEAFVDVLGRWIESLPAD